MATHRRLAAHEDEWYLTPVWSTAAFLRYEHFTGNILDCCCGKGHMTEVLKRLYPGRVIASDLFDRGYGQGNVDFLTTNRYRNGVDNIVINPPFDMSEEFFFKAYQLARRKVCMILRLAFLEGADRYMDIFAKTPPSRIWVSSERISMYKGTFAGDRDSGGSTAYAWFVWDKQNPSRDTLTKWIPPYYKPIKQRKRKYNAPPIFRFSRQFHIERAFAKPFDL